MPSQTHEALILLFRNRPQLAADLLRDALHVEVPAYTEARIGSAELTDTQPTEYRADLVVLLGDGEPVLGIVVEMQLSADEAKRFSWPVYVTTLRARVRVPVCLLVVTVDEAVAKWASKPVDLGGGNHFAPLVLGPSGVPEVTDKHQAMADPELAVFSAMAHGADPDSAKAVRIAQAAMAATAGLDDEREDVYLDLVLASLSEAARRSLKAMDPAKYRFQSEEMKGAFSKGRVEGFAETMIKLLSQRFGSLSAEAENRVRASTIEALSSMTERVLTAKTLEEALGSH